MVYVVEVDMDLEENKHPIQHLDESEDIHTDIIALSDLSTYIQGTLAFVLRIVDQLCPLPCIHYRLCWGRIHLFPKSPLCSIHLLLCLFE